MSYSQFNEEEFLNEFFKDTPVGTFCDIGANDGITGSNTRALWERGWHGVMVEASPGTFRQLQAAYGGKERIRLVHAAVCDHGGTVTFYEHKTIPYCGWNSLKREWAAGFGIDQFNEVTVPALTIAELGLPNNLDFLSIDTEGNDHVILKCLPDSLRPRLIMAEIDKYDNDRLITELLTPLGYKRVFTDEANAAFAL